MENKNIIAVIDLGTFNLKCAIFSITDNSSKLIGFSKNKTEGIHNSTIINVDRAVRSIRKCLAEAEKKSKINLNKINVLIEPSQIITTKVSKYKKIDGSKIEKSDISFLLKEAKKQVESNDYKLSHLHIFNCKYIVDNKHFKGLPLNIYADQFSLENAFISIPKNILKNISEIFHSCDIEINRFIFSSYAAGICCFTQDQIDYGCGIIDIGYEKTSLALFKNSSLIHAVSFPIGSNHITKDIARGCYLSETESEIIKKDISIIENLDKEVNGNKFLSEEYFSKTKFRKISTKFVKDIILARLNEILNKVFEEIDLIQTNSIKHNLFFIGGGSKINGLSKIVNISSSFSVNNSDFEKSKLFEKANIAREFFPCYGAYQILNKGFSSEAIGISNKGKNEKSALFNRIFNIFN